MSNDSLKNVFNGMSLAIVWAGAFFFLILVVILIEKICTLIAGTGG